MLLKNKTAVIYGAAGSMGSIITKAFAKEGAIVFITGRTKDKLEKLGKEINDAGGKAFVSIVDAMNKTEVSNHLNEVLKQVPQIDISFNIIGIENKQGVLLTQMSVDEFVQPIEQTLRTQFITATAAVNVMKQKSSGVVLSLSATPGGVGYPNVGGFGPACAALENFINHLAVEFGVYGIRAVNIRSGGSPDSKPFREFFENDPVLYNEVMHGMKADTMLKELPSRNDIANIAVFLASDMASKITGVTIDATAGTTVGLNYRTSNNTLPFPPQ